MDPHPFINAVVTSATLFIYNAQFEQNHHCYEEVKSVLEKNAIRILKIVPMYSIGIDGYFLELDGDGYSVLRELR